MQEHTFSTAYEPYEPLPDRITARLAPRRIKIVLSVGLAALLAVAIFFRRKEPILVATMVPMCTNGFPTDFIWGLGTAAYQIEGGANMYGREPSIWDDFSHTPGKVRNGDTGDTACDHVHRMREDVGLMRAIGLEHYRFSISWSRVMSWDAATSQMKPNELGLQFYDELLDALAAAGIKPYVTLYHWDLPSALHKHKGGWHTPNNQGIIDEFVRYADLIWSRYAHRVAFWVTFNEPWTFTVEGYDAGNMAPGCVPFQAGPEPCANGDVNVYVVAHNVLNAHAAAAERFHNVYQPKHGGVLSITLNCEMSLPKDGGSAADAAAAERAMQFSLGWWLQPILTGEYPAVMRQNVGSRLPHFTKEESARLIGSIDVLALNHYSTHLVTDLSDRPRVRTGDGSWADDQQLSITFGVDWIPSESPWLHMYAPGLRGLLGWATAPSRWRGAVYVTENGWSARSMTAEEAAHDQVHVAYLSQYTEQLRLALVEDGVDVRGYFGWSLMDNYEWADGYSKRFGLYFVDYATQQRTPKAAALWWNATRRCIV
jgi:beta-glucosidase